MSAVAVLPENIAALKDLVVAQRREIEQQRQHIAALEEQIKLWLARRFAPASEKLPADQLALFNEAEREAGAEEQASGEADTLTVPEHTRARPGRRPLPEALPRVEVLHDLSDAERACPHGCGAMRRIGEEVSEQLDLIPAKVQVLRHVRVKYACPACAEGVHTAPLPPQPIPKSNASPGLLAHIVVSKYQDALPLHRQERILARLGVELPRATLANWMIRLGELSMPLTKLLEEHLLAAPVLGIDETPVQVLKEPGRKPTSPSYMWVRTGGGPAQRIVLFHYAPSRGTATAQALLDGYTGIVVSDGYEVYERACAPAMIHAGCWVHARRRFAEVRKAQPGAAKLRHGHADTALHLIGRLYRIERRAKEAGTEERLRLRQAESRAIIDTLRNWLEETLPTVPPQTLLGKGLTYLHRQWPKLIRFLDDGRIPLDTNATENAIRPFVVGRKNWLFCDTPRGAEASARLYSLIETAKANGREPYAYLRHLFTELPKAKTRADLEALLPYHATP